MTPCPNGHQTQPDDAHCGTCGAPTLLGAALTGREDCVARGRERGKRNRLVILAVAITITLVAGAAIWSSSNDGNNRPSSALEAHEPAHPAEGRAECLDPQGDVISRTGRGTLSTVQTSNGRAVDLTKVLVTVADGALDLRLEFFSAPFEYDSGTLYAYDIGIYRPGDSDPINRRIYTMYVGSDGIGIPGAPSRTERFHGIDGEIASARFDIQGRHIAMTVPLKDLPSLPARFEFSAHANFTVPFADTPNPGLWDDSCPHTDDPDGAMEGARLPTFPAATTSTSHRTSTTTEPPGSPTRPTKTLSGYPTLPPAASASVVPICEDQPQTDGRGFTLGTCADGTAINRTAWAEYARYFPQLLSLPADASSSEIADAAWETACTTLEASFSQVGSVLHAVASYHGWDDTRWQGWDAGIVDGTRTC